jgi:transposase
MRKKLPTIHESAEAVQQRMKSEKDVKKRQRLPALYRVVSGQAQPRTDIAPLLGVHRHSVAAWLAAYAEGGREQALSYPVPTPPVHRRMTDTALTALQAKRKEPSGFAGYAQICVWLAKEHQVDLSYSSVHALVRYRLPAKPKRPRLSHRKRVQTP